MISIGGRLSLSLARTQILGNIWTCRSAKISSKRSVLSMLFVTPDHSVF